MTGDKYNSTETAIYKALESRVATIRAEVLDDAVKEFTRRVKEAVGNTAIDVASLYSVERLGGELLIRVKVI